MKISPETNQLVIDGLLTAIRDAKRKNDSKLVNQLQKGLIEHMHHMLDINQNIEDLH